MAPERWLESTRAQVREIIRFRLHVGYRCRNRGWGAVFVEEDDRGLEIWTPNAEVHLVPVVKQAPGKNTYAKGKASCRVVKWSRKNPTVILAHGPYVVV